MPEPRRALALAPPASAPGGAAPTEHPSAGTVADAMVHAPKTLPADATVAEVAAVLAGAHVHMALLVADGRLVGTVTDPDLQGDPPPATPALDVATVVGRTTAPDRPLDDVRRSMVAAGQRRLAVVDDHGVLLGLLCLKRTLAGFCSDRDVAARSSERRRSDEHVA